MPSNPVASQAPIASYRDTAGMNYVSQDALQFPRDVLPSMVKLNPEQYRFLTVATRFGQSKGPVVEHPYEFQWYLQRELPYSVTLAASATDSGTTLTYAAGNTARLTTAQNLVNTRTGESVRLSLTAADITATTTANIIRSTGAIAAQAMLSGDVLAILGSTRTEASADPVPIGFKPELTSNYTVELALAAGATHKIKTSSQYAGWSPDADQKLVGDYFRYQVEVELLLGEQEYSIATDNYPVTRTNGLMRTLTSNVQTLSSTPDWFSFINLAYPNIRYGQGGIYGRNIKHLFVSRSVGNWIDSLPTQHVVVNDIMSTADGENSGITWGWAVKVLNVNGCMLHIHRMPWWDEFSGGALNLAQAALFVDPNHIGVRYRKEGRIGLLPARGPNGRAPNNVTYETVCWHFDGGLQYDFEAAHGVMYFPTV